MRRELPLLRNYSCVFLLAVMLLAGCTTQSQSIAQIASPLVVESPSKLGSVDWVHGSAYCTSILNDPNYQEWQQVQYAENTFVFRQNKCSNYEGPFVYLFIGSDRGLLIDSGATVAGGKGLLQLVLNITDLPVLLAHTHGHGDHRQGDDAFRNHERMSVVDIGRSAVEKFFGFANWPNDEATFDLGGREIQLLPIPGHNDDDLAFYDQLTKVVVTGDTLYPGRLYVRNWSAYRNSISRLADWVGGKPVSVVLGTHIEMSATLNQDYPIGTTYQPDEHPLPLTVSDIDVLRAAMEETASPERVPLGSYIVWPI